MYRVIKIKKHKKKRTAVVDFRAFFVYITVFFLLFVIYLLLNPKIIQIVNTVKTHKYNIMFHEVITIMYKLYKN